MNNQRNDMQITERELTALTAELDEMHQEVRPRMLSALSEFTESLGEHLDTVRRAVHIDATRRNFMAGGLVTAGVVGSGLILAGCGSDSSSSTGADTGAGSGTAGGASGDLVVAQLAASLEVLAVGTYDTALKAAGQGAFGAVPPSFGAFATTAKMQHQDHGDGWNAALASAGLPKVTTPNAKYNAVVQGALPGLKTIVDVAKLALTLETVACETYVAGSGLVTDKANRKIALTIAPVEAQHIAILNFVLGMYPVPLTNIATDMAADPASLKG